MNSRSIIILILFILAGIILYQMYKNKYQHGNLDNNIYQPDNIDSLVAAIKKDNNKIRPNYKASNDLYKSTGIKIDNTLLNKIIGYNPDTNIITVQSGTIISQIVDYLDNKGLMLSSIPSNIDMSIGEAIATAAHGSNINFGTIADQIEDMIVVLDGGNIRKIEFKDPEFPACACNLGMIGCVYLISLKCVPLEHVPVVKSTTNWSNISRVLVDKVRKEDIVSLQIKPRSKKVYCNYPDPTDTPIHEIALPLQNLVPAVNHILDLIADDYYMGIDFTGADHNSWFSPASGRETAWLKLYTENKQLAKLFEKELYQFSGRPCWETAQTLTPNIVRTLYGKSSEYMVQTRDKFDPNNIFSNTFLMELFS